MVLVWERLQNTIYIYTINRDFPKREISNFQLVFAMERTLGVETKNSSIFSMSRFHSNIPVETHGWIANVYWCTDNSSMNANGVVGRSFHFLIRRS